MSVQLTTMKGTSSIASDRITINDNFKIVADTIDEIGSYLDYDAGTITGILSISTRTLTASAGIDLTAGTLSIPVNSKISLNGTDMKGSVVGTSSIKMVSINSILNLGILSASDLNIVATQSVGSTAAYLVFAYDANPSILQPSLYNVYGGTAYKMTQS